MGDCKFVPILPEIADGKYTEISERSGLHFQDLARSGNERTKTKQKPELILEHWLPKSTGSWQHQAKHRAGGNKKAKLCSFASQRFGDYQCKGGACLSPLLIPADSFTRRPGSVPMGETFIPHPVVGFLGFCSLLPQKVMFQDLVYLAEESCFIPSERVKCLGLVLGGVKNKNTDMTGWEKRDDMFVNYKEGVEC